MRRTLEGESGSFGSHQQVISRLDEEGHRNARRMSLRTRHQKKAIDSVVRYLILDYTINIAFRGLRLRAFTRNAFQHGHSRLGNIVQLPETELRNLAPSKKAFEKIIKTLHANRLDAGMEAPGWVSPDDPTRPASERPKNPTL